MLKNKTPRSESVHLMEEGAAIFASGEEIGKMRELTVSMTNLVKCSINKTQYV